MVLLTWTLKMFSRFTSLSDICWLSKSQYRKVVKNDHFIYSESHLLILTHTGKWEATSRILSLKIDFFLCVCVCLCSANQILHIYDPNVYRIKLASMAKVWRKTFFTTHRSNVHIALHCLSVLGFTKPTDIRKRSKS